MKTTEKFSFELIRDNQFNVWLNSCFIYDKIWARVLECVDDNYDDCNAFSGRDIKHGDIANGGDIIVLCYTYPKCFGGKEWYICLYEVGCENKELYNNKYEKKCEKVKAISDIKQIFDNINQKK